MDSTNLEDSISPRYLVFRGDDEYMKGGWGDFVGSANNVENAVHVATTHPNSDDESPITGQGDWYHIVDVMVYQRVVLEGTFQYGTVEVSSDTLDDGSSVDGLEFKVLESVTCEVVHRDDE